jgi:hypothetical protein
MKYRVSCLNSKTVAFLTQRMADGVESLQSLINNARKQKNKNLFGSLCTRRYRPTTGSQEISHWFECAKCACNPTIQRAQDRVLKYN